jgi:hypothetical protein
LNKRLYVLEDVDCADLKDVVKERMDKPNKKQDNADEEDEV